MKDRTMQNSNSISTSEQRVLIFNAQTPKVSNRQIYFLFSQQQMEDVLMDTSVQPVPFAPGYIEGVAEWRDQVLPVISLEACLGMETLKFSRVQRLMVVQAPRNEGSSMEICRVMLRVVPPIRMLTLPIECSPVSDEWIPERFFSRAVYEWKDGFLVVAHMANILSGRN